MLEMIIERLWVMSLQACVLIIIVLIAGAFLKKYPKRYAYCLWALVGLRLLCPVFIETSFSLQPDMPSFVESTAGSGETADIKQGSNIKENNAGKHGNNQEFIGQPGAYEGILDKIQSDLEGNADSTLQGSVSQAVGAAGKLPIDAENSTVKAKTELDKEQIFKILSVIYLIGVGIAALFYAAQYIIIRRRIATAVKGKGNVWFSENISSPFVIGIIRPRIILPYDLTDEEMVYILKHERTHIRHHDPLIRLLGILCIILHWWNPFVWAAVHKMNQDMEMFCDEAALSEATSADKKAYAGTLLSFSVKRSGFSVGLSFGESNTERRVRNIMKKNKKSFIIVGIIALLAVFCVVAFMTIPKSDEDGNGKEQETTTPKATTEHPTTENKVTIDIDTGTTDGESQKPTEDTTENTDRMNPFYEAFLRNEISVQSPIDPNVRLTVMDDKNYETEFVNAKKSYALVDVNDDGRPELLFKISGDYPSEIMYIFGSMYNELVCYDVFETHTNKMAFGVYDYGFVWRSQNYDGNVREYYTYTAEGKQKLVTRFTEGEEDKMAAYEGNEPEWHDWRSVYEPASDKLLKSFLAGEISATNLYSEEFKISELDMSGNSWDSYSIGDMLDLDNDGENELILHGPYGGMYLDAADGKVKAFAAGEGTAGNLSYIYCEDAYWIVHSDTMHSGRTYYAFDRYSGAGKIAESATLLMTDDEGSGKKYYYKDTEIWAEKYTEVYQRFFGEVSIEEQINIIEQSISMWKLSPDYANEMYSYAITDLDQNGRLEVIVSNEGGTGHYTYSHFYEINEQLDALVECEFNFVEGSSQPDIIEEAVDMYYDHYTDTYYYIEYDLIRNGPEYYIVQNALSLKDGKVEVHELATEIQRYGAAAEPGITYLDSHGNEISESFYNEMADNAFYGFDKYRAQLGWRDMKGLTNVNYKVIRDVLKQSYETFNPFAASYGTWTSTNSRFLKYQSVLLGLCRRHELPGTVDYGFTEGSDMSQNSFAIYDIDKDGKEELIVNYVTTYNAGMVKKIYDYNYVTRVVSEEFSEYPTTTIYDNGVILAYASHNHGRAPMVEDFWPYRLYKYNVMTDKYESVAIVDGWDKTYNSEGFPEEADKDGDGIVYCVMTNGEWDYGNAMDGAEYEAWIASYIGKAKEAEIPYMELTENCISIAYTKYRPLYRYAIIDDDPSKSREELALELMEAYRAYSASLPVISEGYFDELKIISLTCYDESDSDPTTLIGEITEDILRFDVGYAVNAPNMILAGSWDEGSGEYEGYATNGVGVHAVRYNGKWYMVGMGNG